MVNDWQQIKLGQLAKITMGQSPKGELCNSIGDGVPLLNGPTEFGSSYPTATQFTTDPKRFSEKGDLLFCVRGSTTGRMNWSNQEYAIGRGLAAFQHYEGEDYKHFLRAIIEFKLPELLASATGSTFPNVSKNQLNNLKVLVPLLPEQKAIAHILGTLDEKMELNRQMNETLEAMAQVMFKSWFVDFDPVIDNALLTGKAIPEPLKERAELRQAQLDGDKAKINSEINNLFPSEFEFTDEFGWIPKGWEVKNLSEIAENIFSGGTPNTKKAEYWNGDLNWFSSGETRENIVVETEKTITEIGVSESSTKLARYGDVLIASAGQGHTRGQTSFCSIDTYFNQSVVCVRPQEPTHYSWLFFNLYGRYEEMRALSDSHSIRGSLTTKLLSSMSIIKPDENILAEYENIVGKHILKIKENKLINNNLAKLRDTLLPKLMSGELRIPDAEKLVADI